VRVGDGEDAFEHRDGTESSNPSSSSEIAEQFGDRRPAKGVAVTKSVTKPQVRAARVERPPAFGRAGDVA
jgi:hypothetical protein